MVCPWLCKYLKFADDILPHLPLSDKAQTLQPLFLPFCLSRSGESGYDVVQFDYRVSTHYGAPI
jgi:hypothetical protein